MPNLTEEELDNILTPGSRFNTGALLLLEWSTDRCKYDPAGVANLERLFGYFTTRPKNPLVIPGLSSFADIDKRVVKRFTNSLHAGEFDEHFDVEKNTLYKIINISYDKERSHRVMSVCPNDYFDTLPQPQYPERVKHVNVAVVLPRRPFDQFISTGKHLQNAASNMCATRLAVLPLLYQSLTSVSISKTSIFYLPWDIRKSEIETFGDLGDEDYTLFSSSDPNSNAKARENLEAIVGIPIREGEELARFVERARPDSTGLLFLFPSSYLSPLGMQQIQSALHEAGLDGEEVNLGFVRRARDRILDNRHSNGLLFDEIYYIKAPDFIAVLPDQDTTSLVAQFGQATANTLEMYLEGERVGETSSYGLLIDGKAKCGDVLPTLSDDEEEDDSTVPAFVPTSAQHNTVPVPASAPTTAQAPFAGQGRTAAHPPTQSTLSSTVVEEVSSGQEDSDGDVDMTGGRSLRARSMVHNYYSETILEQALRIELDEDDGPRTH